jgi:penicillin-binding protein 1A
MVTGYAVFANGGFKINPYIVREIRNEKNQVLAHSAEVQAGDDSIRAIDPRNAFMMDNHAARRHHLRHSSQSLGRTQAP